MWGILSGNNQFGGHLSGGDFVHLHRGGFCPRGICPGGFCPGGFCPGSQNPSSEFLRRPIYEQTPRHKLYGMPKQRNT